MTRTISCGVVLFAAVLGLPFPRSIRAQDSTATVATIRAPAVLANDFFQIEIQNSRRVRAAFSASNLGAMLADDQFAQLRESWMAPLAQVFLGGRPDDEGAGKALLQRFLATEFVLRIGARITWDESRQERVSGGFELRFAGDVDREAWLSTITEFVAADKEPAPAIARDGIEWAVRRSANGDGVVLPHWIDDRIVGVFGDDLDAAVASRLAVRGAPAAALDPVTAVHARVDSGALVAEWLQHRGQALRKEAARATGLDSLAAVEFRIRAPGPQLEFDATFTFDDAGPRGIVAALFPAADSEPRFAARIPDDGRDWFAGHLDFDVAMTALYRLIAAEFSFGEDLDLAACEAKLREMVRPFLGIDLDRDLGVGLDDAFVFATMDALGARPSRAPSERSDPAFALVFSVADAEKVEAATDALARAVHGEIRATEEDASFLADARRWVFGHGSDLDPLVAMLSNEEIQRGPNDALRRYPTVVANAKKRLPAGLTGVGVVDIEHLASAFEVALFPYVVLSDPSFRFDSPIDLSATLREVEASLRERHLDRAVIATGRQPRSFTLRLLW